MLTVIRSYSPGNRTRERIGAFVLDQDTEFTIEYEVAAWHTEILVPAGEYPLFTNGYYGFVKMEGPIVSEYTPSLFAGVSIGSSPQGTKHHHVGNMSTKVLMPYLYYLASVAAHNDDIRSFGFGNGRIVLDDDVEAECEDFVSSIDGRTLHLHHFSRRSLATA